MRCKISVECCPVLFPMTVAAVQMLYRLQGTIDVILRIEITETEPDCPTGEGANRPVGGGCAVQARSGHDAELFVEGQRYLRGRHPVYIERNNGDLVRRVGRSVYMNAADGFHAVQKASGQPHFFCTDVIEAPSYDIVHTGAQACEPDGVGRAGFVSVGHEVRLLFKFRPASRSTE
jgi:hypothetical protein